MHSYLGVLLPSRAYKKGYSLERFCQLTLEFNGFHVKRNTMSIGIEDVLAFDGSLVLLIQCKNTKRGEKSMSKDELEILKLHAKEHDAVPLYLYKDGRGKYVWQEVESGWTYDNLKPYTREWYHERMLQRDMLRKMKKKNVNEYNKYVLKNWNEVKDYIC